MRGVNFLLPLRCSCPGRGEPSAQQAAIEEADGMGPPLSKGRRYEDRRG